MDSEGCEEGFATDRFLIYDAPRDCAVSLSLFFGLVGFVFLGRVLVTMNQYRTRHKISREVYKGVEFVTLFGAAIYLTLHLLSGYFVISTVNGSSGVAYMVWSLFYAGQQFLGWKNRTTKWLKLVPLVEGQVKPVCHQRILALIQVLMLFSVIVVLTGFLILGWFIFPAQLWTAQLAFAGLGCFRWLILSAYGLQARQGIKQARQYGSPDLKFIRRMKSFCFLIFLSNFTGGLVFFLHAGNVIPMTWLWVVVFGGMDIFLFYFVFGLQGLYFGCRRMTSRENEGSDDSQDIHPSGRDMVLHF